jgi:hypothetical protein
MGRAASLAVGSAVVVAALSVGSGTAVASPTDPAAFVTSAAEATSSGDGSGERGCTHVPSPLDLLCQGISGGQAAPSGGSGGGATGSTGTAASSSGYTGGGTTSGGASGAAGAPAGPGTSGTPGASGAMPGGLLSSILGFLAGCLRAMGL